MSGAEGDGSSELKALRRRFIKDQESSRIYFAKREARRKKMEEVNFWYRNLTERVDRTGLVDVCVTRRGG